MHPAQATGIDPTLGLRPVAWGTGRPCGFRPLSAVKPAMTDTDAPATSTRFMSSQAGTRPFTKCSLFFSCRGTYSRPFQLRNGPFCPLCSRARFPVLPPIAETPLPFGGARRGAHTCDPSWGSWAPLGGRPARLPALGAHSRRPDAVIDKVPFPKLPLSTPARSAHRRFVHFQSCGCPVGVEGAPESNCSLRFSRQGHSTRFQLRNLPECNLSPRAISCTRV